MSKVALSASFWSNPVVAEELDSCEVIYTTQIQNRDLLQARFGNRVRFIPDSTPSMIEFLKSRHDGDEIITFVNLLALNKATFNHNLKVGHNDNGR